MCIVPTVHRKVHDMDGTFSENDISRVVEADRANVWHHLVQHQPFFTGADPKIIIEGKGLRVWDQKGIEHIDAVSGGVCAGGGPAIGRDAAPDLGVGGDWCACICG